MNLDFEFLSIVAAVAVLAEVRVITVVPATDGSLVFLDGDAAEEQG